MQGRTLTVEIFKDLETPEVDLDCIAAGVARVAGVATGLAVERAGRSLRLTRPGAPDVSFDYVRQWPRFSADINIIGTTRPIVTSDKTGLPGRRPEELQVVGNSQISGPLRHLLRIALVRDAVGLEPDYTTAHEFGHLLNVRPKVLAQGVSKEHCASAECLMYSVYETAAAPYRDKALSTSRFIQNSIRPVRRLEYCGGCAESIGRHAFFLTQLKNGLTVPDALLPHYGVVE
jgi:hypothetical protein